MSIGIIIAILGLAGGIIYIIQLVTADPTELSSAVGGAALLVVGVGLGGALAWHGRRAVRRESSDLLRLPAFWLLLLFYLPIIIVGQILISLDLWPALTFPVFHILAAAIPPLAILAFAARMFKATLPRWRDVILQLTSGIFLSTLIGFIAEIVLGALLFLAVALGAALTPIGLASLERLAENLQDPFLIQNPDNLLSLIMSPPVLVTGAIIVVVLAPLIEELIKPLGVYLMSYRRPSRAQVFLWGLASGAGFALAENLFNTIAGLDVWAVVMVFRLGGTAMHCLGSGLVALGWRDFWVERRPWPLVGAYAISVTMHALWNLNAIGLAGLSMFTLGQSSETILALIGGIALLLVVFLFVLSGAIVIALVVLAYRLRADIESALLSSEES
jgi:RsiW-degrading membrane proteinase PrsW (M82 family)